MTSVAEVAEDSNRVPERLPPRQIHRARISSLRGGSAEDACVRERVQLRGARNDLSSGQSVIAGNRASRNTSRTACWDTAASATTPRRKVKSIGCSRALVRVRFKKS